MLTKDTWLGLATALVICSIAGAGLGISIYLVRSGTLRLLDAPPILLVANYLLAGASGILILNVAATVVRWFLPPTESANARN